ncbi:MAG TPA: hypothetical protein VHV55_18345 [Pirellulales bacterium]|jgi:hypothetical protein|nr:hypothetical protein [Pirellulales bacterium]
MAAVATLRLNLVALAFIALLSAAWAADDSPIDWHRARALHARVQQGEKLGEEDQAYYERAKQAMAKGQGPGKVAAGQSQDSQKAGPPPEPRTSTGLVPLTELGQEKYKGETGGLYGDGRNTPPPALAEAAQQETRLIHPVNAQGFSDPQGKIALLSIGMSNTTQEFSVFKQMADADPAKSPRLVIVDGAQGGQTAPQWAEVDARPWGVADERLRQAGTTPAQVQVAWIKQAIGQPARFGDFPAHAHQLENDLVKVLHSAMEHYPNLRIAYLSSRIYAGNARTALNPEPYAYESAFAVRWLIDRQLKGDQSLNWEETRGTLNAPLLLWGPYLWADGIQSRKSDGLSWQPEDLGADGTHPSDSGRRKVAEQLLKFFKTDADARSWFVAAGK